MFVGSPQARNPEEPIRRIWKSLIDRRFSHENRQTVCRRALCFAEYPCRCCLHTTRKHTFPFFSRFSSFALFQLPFFHLSLSRHKSIIKWLNAVVKRNEFRRGLRLTKLLSFFFYCSSASCFLRKRHEYICKLN